MTYQEFDKNINLGSLKNRDLETYLLALLKLVEDEREQILTAELLLKHALPNQKNLMLNG